MALNLGNTYTGHDAVNALRNEYMDIVGVDEIINKVLYKLMIRDYNNSQEAKYGVTFSQFSHAGLQEKGAFAKMVRNEVGRTLGIVRNKMRKIAAESLPRDPRKARQAVKSSKWKKQIGGSVSLYDRLKRNGYRAAIPPTKSGRPRKMSKRTEQIMSYWGTDRAFILRFINHGATDRMTGRYGGPSLNRGSIPAHNFFRNADGIMMAETGEMTERIEKLIEEVLG